MTDEQVTTIIDKFNKMKLSLRYYLLGKGYYLAIEAMEFAAAHHTGTRKDGVTPEFMHQISIAHYIRTLPLMYPERTIASGLLHDVREDYNVADVELCRRFGSDITTDCIILDKNGKDIEFYHRECGTNPVTSIVKPSDRVNNLQTMGGVFTPEKQQRYVDETEHGFLPIIKHGRRTFPKQEPAYENIKHMLVSQIQLIKAVLDK